MVFGAYVQVLLLTMRARALLEDKIFVVLFQELGLELKASSS